MGKNFKTWKDLIEIAKSHKYKDIKHKLYDVGYALFQATNEITMRKNIVLQLPAWFLFFLINDEAKISNIEGFEKTKNELKTLKIVHNILLHKNLMPDYITEKIFDLYNNDKKSFCGYSAIKLAMHNYDELKNERQL